MAFLGISEDLFDSGVALCDGHKVLFASNEERYTRRKNEGGFPYRALDALLTATGAGPSDIECICVSGLMTPPLPVRMFPGSHNWLFEARRAKKESFLRGFLDDVTFVLPISHTSERSLMRRATMPFLAPVTRRTLPRSLRKIPIRFVDHHEGHAFGAWRMSGFQEALCVTADGMGDGLSMTVWRACADERGAGMQRLWTASSRDSLGLFYQVPTDAFGFLSCRDEGKLTGLAAHGDPARVHEPWPFRFDGDKLVYSGPVGQRGVEWARKTLMARYTREDVAAWAQAILEHFVVDLCRRWLRETGLTKLAVAGGVVANVKLNQRLHEIDEVESLFVYPNMGDGGLAHGAICAIDHRAPQRVQDVFFGDEFPGDAIEAAIRNANLPYEHCDDIAERIADALVEGRLVARFAGKMEWGPRALGNRSVLARTTDRAVVDRLNRLLKRSDFMPFAPAILDEDGDEYAVGADAARHAAEFMTVCFDCTERMKRENPAVVHVDGTARAQLVREASNPAFHRILSAFKRRTGCGVLLNTSFNIHEEPIVCTPEEAVAAFRNAHLDYLAIGDFLVNIDA
jgi:carbamoyltransferase